MMSCVAASQVLRAVTVSSEPPGSVAVSKLMAMRILLNKTLHSHVSPYT